MHVLYLHFSDKDLKLEFTEEPPSDMTDDEQAKLEEAAAAKCRAIEGDEDEVEEEEEAGEETKITLDDQERTYEDNEIVYL